ncbi:MAG: histidine kinase dimerization/phospho-acceptor domain-containing protein [Gemmatimonadota bacterium]|nr:histidine kinase dimerization/phospho-acceptor domain-containing protein [Gemmatimonadota bacterium]
MLLGLASPAVPTAVAQTTLVEEWRWVHFGVAEGLPSPVVHSVSRARDGTMWAATDRGPAWFDGYRWQVVRDQAGRTLPTATTGYVAPAADSSVVFRTGQTVYRVAGRGEAARPIPPVPGGEWASRVIGVRGEIWAIVARDAEWMLTRFADGAWRTEPWPGPSPAPSYDPQLHVGSEGRALLSVGTSLWERRAGVWRQIAPFAPARGMIRMFATTPSLEERIVLRSPDSVQGVWARGPSVGAGQWQKFPEFGRESPAAFDIGLDGSAVAILDAGDFLYCDSNGWRRLPAPTFLGTATAAAFDAMGDVWFSTRDGVVLWRRTSERWTQWREPSASGLNRVNGLAISAGGQLAAATAEGVAYPESGGVLRRDAALPPIAFTAIAWGGDGTLWAGSGGGATGVFQRSAAGWRHRTDAPGLDQAALHRIIVGRDGVLWLLGLPYGRTGRGGLWKAVGARIDAVLLPESLTGARFYDMTEDATGRRWFATDRGVARERDGTIELIDVASGLGGDQPFSLAPSDDGGVWVGLRMRGVVKIRADLSIERSSADAPHPLGQVTLHRAADGKVWATNPDGIWVHIGGSWSILTQSFGLPTPAVWPVVSRGGDVYVGTMGAGVLRLRLGELEGARPRVSVWEPRVEEGRLMLRWNVAVERGRVPPENVASRWRLDDRAWSPWSAETAVPAPVTLPWRRHVLQVEARTPLGVTNAQPAELTFRVPPPAWWRREVLVVVAVLVALLAWLTVLLTRRRRQQDAMARRVREAERMELVGSFAAGMAHELNNLLTTISVNAELVEDAAGSEAPSPSEEIRRAAMQAAAQLRSVLAFTRDRELVLTTIDLAEVLRQQQAPVSALFPSGIEARWHVPSDPVPVKAETNALAAILRALAEHSRDSMTATGWFDVTLRIVALNAARRADLGVGDAPEVAELVVSDSGAGMTAEQSVHALEPAYPTRDAPASSLSLVYGLVRRFGGAVTVEPSLAGEGGRLRLYFPLAGARVA